MQLERVAVAAVGAQHDVGVEHRHQRLEVAVAGGGEVGVDDRLLAGQVRVRRGRRSRTRRRARLASWRVACGERSTIAAISSNGTANMSCSTNASRSAGLSVSSTTCSAIPTDVGQQRLVLGIGPGRRVVDDRLRPEAVERLLAAGPAGPEHVQADPGDDRRQPPLEAVDLLGVGPLQPQPRLLHGVVGLAERAEDPVGDRAQPGPLAVELVGQLEFVHRCHTVRVSRVIADRPREPQPM